MKAALLEPFPRICGMNSWLWHLKQGFTTLGHEASIVSPAKSGKPSVKWGVDDTSTLSSSAGVRWTPWQPDIIVKWPEVLDVLAAHDLAVISEPRCMYLDDLAVKNLAVPLYVDIIRRLGGRGVPWTTVVHGQLGDYSPKMAPFADALLNEAPGFSGRLLAHFPVPGERPPPFTKLELTEAPLPYQPLLPERQQGEDSLTRLVITGRVMPNKGHHLLAYAAEAAGLGEGCDITLAGSPSIGAGANMTFHIYEMMVRDLGWEGVRGGVGGLDRNVIQAFTWEVKKPGRPVVRYAGPYDNGAKLCSEQDVHVNLTASSFTTAFTEYSTLEAMDGGCIVTAPGQLLAPQYRGARASYTTTISVKKCQEPGSEALLRPVFTALQQAIHVARSPEARAEITSHNQKAIAETQDPADVVKLLLSTL